MAFITPTAIAFPPGTHSRILCKGPASSSPFSSVSLHLPSLHLPSLLTSRAAPPAPPAPPFIFRRGDRPDDEPNAFDPIAALVALWRRYSHALNTAPLLTKALSASVLVFLSDLIAQCLTSRSDPARLLRYAVYGFLLAGPIGHYWFQALELAVPQPGITGILKKLALDQLAYAPFATALFFAVMRTAEGSSLDDTVSFFRSSYLSAMRTNYTLWPAANFINFAFVPAPHRVIFVSAVSVAWLSFLSVVANEGS